MGKTNLISRVTFTTCGVKGLWTGCGNSSPADGKLGQLNLKKIIHFYQ